MLTTCHLILPLVTQGCFPPLPLYIGLVSAAKAYQPSPMTLTACKEQLCYILTRMSSNVSGSIVKLQHRGRYGESLGGNSFGATMPNVLTWEFSAETSADRPGPEVVVWLVMNIFLGPGRRYVGLPWTFFLVHSAAALQHYSQAQGNTRPPRPRQSYHQTFVAPVVNVFQGQDGATSVCHGCDFNVDSAEKLATRKTKPCGWDREWQEDGLKRLERAS